MVQPRALLKPANWKRWTAELRGFLEMRGHRSGFIAVRLEQDLVYDKLPKRVWPTKSFEFWVFLAGLLQCVRPESILEIGSGRSTSYLAEYAYKHDQRFVSIEQSVEWTTLNNALARFANLPTDYVRHVPLSSDGFYEEKALARILPPSADFVFLDGPNGPRDAPRQIELYRKLATSARVVVLDDLQIPTIFPQVEIFRTAEPPRDAVFFRYPVKTEFDNYLAVLFDRELRTTVDRLVECLKVEVFDAVTEQICVDKTHRPSTSAGSG